MEPSCPTTVQPDPTATYPHDFLFLRLGPIPSLWHWGSSWSFSVVQRSLMFSMEVLTHDSFCPSLFIPDSTSSPVRYSLPHPSATTELFTVKGKCPAVQNVPICWQHKPNQNHKFKHPMNYLPFIILTADSSVSAFSEGTAPRTAGLMVMLVSGSDFLWFI